MRRCTGTVAVAQAQDWDGYTPLMDAAAQGHLVVAKQLLRAGADTALVDKVWFWTPQEGYTLLI